MTYVMLNDGELETLSSLLSRLYEGMELTDGSSEVHLGNEINAVRDLVEDLLEEDEIEDPNEGSEVNDYASRWEM